MKKIIITEKNTGILYYCLNQDDKKIKSFIPYKNLDEAEKYLQKFYEIKQKNGIFVKDAFKKFDINWFPTTVSFLFWHCFYPYVQYREFLCKYSLNEYDYQFQSNGRLRNLVEILQPKHQNKIKKLVKTKLAFILRTMHNYKALYQNKDKSLLFFRYGLSDFRTKEIKSKLNSLNYQYFEVASMTLNELLGNFVKIHSKPFYTLHTYNADISVNTSEYNLPDSIDKQDKTIFNAALQKIYEIISNFQKIFKIYKKELKNISFKKLYGLDDANFVYPLLYACKELGIETIGHQHGLYCPHHAAYMMKGFDSGEYQWYNKVLVWGRYWKDFMERETTCYPLNFFLLGVNKNTYKPKHQRVCGHQGTKNVLIPYEFLADTYVIGKYIIKLQDLGYTIYFKPRSDENLSDQLETYCLSKERQSKIIISENITDELMGQIDYVAGTQTTLIYDLFPYLKETWIFETNFRMLDHLSEQGIAKKIRLEHIEEDIANPAEKGIDQELVDYVFNSEKLEDVLLRELAL